MRSPSACWKVKRYGGSDPSCPTATPSWQCPNFSRRTLCSGENTALPTPFLCSMGSSNSATSERIEDNEQAASDDAGESV